MWIYGAGGFGRETLEACRAAGMEVEGFLDDVRTGETVCGLVARVARDVDPDEFVVAIADPTARWALHHGLVDDGWQPVSVVDPRAVIGPSTTIGAGSVVLATAFVSRDVTLGEAVHVNYQASIGHDSVLGASVTVLPGANIGGATEIRDRVLIGSNAAVLPRLTLEADAVVGAGAVVTHGIASGVTVIGVPARPMRSR